MTENEIIENLDDIWTFGHEPTDEERLAANKAIDLIQELQQYRAIGTVKECREAREIKNKITEIVNQQLIAGKHNYKEVYSCFYDIAKVVQDSY